MAITEPEVAPPWGESISTSPSLVRPTDGFIQGGWPLSASNPTRGFFNWVLKQAHNGIRYFMTRGIPLWSSTDTYVGGVSIVRDNWTGGDGFPRRNVYFCYVSPTLGTAPHLDPNNWIEVPIFLMGQSTNWPREILAFRNAKLQRRGGISHAGFFGGLYHDWAEDWSDVGFTAKTTAPLTGTWAKRWVFEYGVSTAGSIAGGGISTNDPTLGGGGSIAGPRSPRLSMNPFPNAGSTAYCLVESRLSVAVINDDTVFEMEWQGSPGGQSAAVGLSFASQLSAAIGNTAAIADTTGIQGIAILRRVADTNWQLYTNTGSAVFTDTGVAIGAPLRFRLEYHGANVSDTGAARALVFLDGAKVVDVAVSLGNQVPLAYLRARNSANATSNGETGILKFRRNLNPGDNFI